MDGMPEPAHDRPGSVQPGDPEVEAAEGEGLALAPVDITVRLWFDREPEVISPVADWMVCAALNRVLDNYVEYVLTPEEEEEG